MDSSEAKDREATSGFHSSYPDHIDQSLVISQSNESNNYSNRDNILVSELLEDPTLYTYENTMYLHLALNRIKTRPVASSDEGSGVSNSVNTCTQQDIQLRSASSSSSSSSKVRTVSDNIHQHTSASKDQQSLHSSSFPNLQSLEGCVFQGPSLDVVKQRRAPFIATDASVDNEHFQDNLEEKKVLFHIAPLENDYSHEYYAKRQSERVDESHDTESSESRSSEYIKETSTRKNQFRNVKSFSHEISKATYVEGLPRPHSDTNLEDLLEALQVRFDTAKQKVDNELGTFAADLIEILDTSNELPHVWKQKIEDLLILARQCATMTAVDFQDQCKSIVQELDDKRHELPMGLLNKLYTHMLFILTRCTRLLQLDRETRKQEEGCFQKIKHCLRGIPSFESIWVEKREKTPLDSYGKQQPCSVLSQCSPASGSGLSFDKELRNETDAGPFKINRGSGLSAAKLISRIQEEKTMYNNLDEFICRICEEKAPVAHLEAHSMLCALADACDGSGLSLNEKLANMADVLERMSEVGNKHDFLRYLKWNLYDGSNTSSPRFSDLHGRLLDPKSNQAVASPSAGSLTPRSSHTTPGSSQLESLWTEYSMCIETEEVEHIHHLADIARCVADINPLDEGALNVLNDCIHDLRNILTSSRSEALAVGIFGRHLEGLLREMDMLIYKASYHHNSIIEAGFLDNGAVLMEDGFYDLRSRPSHPLYKDRTTIDDFEILKPISRGAFGEVLLARKKTTGDLFAVKVLRKSNIIRKNAVENILAERDILISLCNPFVVRFFYSFTCKENLYLVMEYLNGGDLFSLLRSVGCLDEPVARVYVAELVLALEYLHSIGVVHRDLKPDNILIAQDGHIKLTDFGLSKVGLIDSTDDFSNLSANDRILSDLDIDDDFLSSPVHSRVRQDNGSAVGTPDYLAPEILLGREHGHSADWWSVGIILFECLTGMPPFNADHPQAVFDNILNRDIPWPSGDVVSNEARDLIDRLLIQDPSRRLGSKGAFEVKAHPFFKEINWDTLSMQKAAFVPNPESIDDTGYFTARPFNDENNSLCASICSEECSSLGSSPSTRMLDEGDYDDCVDLVYLSKQQRKRSFTNFSYKNLTQLASMNYDIVSHSIKDHCTSSL